MYNVILLKLPNLEIKVHAPSRGRSFGRKLVWMQLGKVLPRYQVCVRCSSSLELRCVILTSLASPEAWGTHTHTHTHTQGQSNQTMSSTWLTSSLLQRYWLHVAGWIRNSAGRHSDDDILHFVFVSIIPIARSSKEKNKRWKLKVLLCLSDDNFKNLKIKTW